MKTLIRNSTHGRDRSYDMLMCEHEGKKVKFTYETYNAVERMNTEIFDGYKWNHIFNMSDLGSLPDSSMYVRSDDKRKSRCNELFKLAEKHIKLLL